MAQHVPPESAAKGNRLAALCEVDDSGLARIVLNRPEQLNAFNVRMRDDLHAILTALHANPALDAVIITGAGERAFCSGADLTEFGSAPSRVIAREARYLRDVWALLRSLPVPTVAVLHGFAIGSGLEMALCCDFRVAADTTRFRLPEVALGMIPFATGSQTLPRVIGRAQALDLLLTGRWFDAEEARRLGLIHRVAPAESRARAAQEMLEQARRAPREARAAAKSALRRGADTGMDIGLRVEAALAAARLAELTGAQRGRAAGG